MKLLFALVVGCLAVSVGRVQSLHLGTLATVGQHPTQASITLPGGRFCSGTIVNANHILTAARCVLDDNNELFAANQVQIRTGTIGAADPNAPVNVAIALFPHAEYLPSTGEHDIAIIRIQQALAFNDNSTNPNVASAPVHQRALPANTPCTIAAWNAPTLAVPNPLLHFTAVNIFDRDQCRNFNAGAVFEDTLCARSEVAQNRPAICPSNRGAGLLCNGQLVGLASTGFACNTPNSNDPGVYTQVRFYVDWMQEQFTRTRIPNAGPTPHPGHPSSAISSSVSLGVLIIAGLSWLALI